MRKDWLWDLYKATGILIYPLEAAAIVVCVGALTGVVFVFIRGYLLLSGGMQ